jgi:hypothetical protein
MVDYRGISNTKCKVLATSPSKTLHFPSEIFPMYRRKYRKTIPLLPELFAFGGKLDEYNRWLRIERLIPWEVLEEEYAKHFSEVGRPATDAQLVVGLLLLKHMAGLSDVGVVQDVLENPYMQAFYRFEKFMTEKILDPSTLTKMREKLGLEFFKELENKNNARPHPGSQDGSTRTPSRNETHIHEGTARNNKRIPGKTLCVPDVAAGRSLPWQGG